MDECDNHKQIVLKQSSVADKSNKGDLSWANENLKNIVNTYYRTMKSYTLIISGRNIILIFLNAFGKNIPFERMDILYVQLEMSVKKF